MKKIIILFYLFPLIIVAQATTETELQELNKQLLTEYAINHNTAPLEEIAKEDFLLIAAPGMIESKEQAIAGVENLKITSVEVTTDKVILNQNIAIIVGVLKMKGTIMGRPVPKSIRYSSTFIKEDAEWKLQMRTMTPMMMKGGSK